MTACAQSKKDHVRLGRQSAAEALQKALKKPLKSIVAESNSKPLPNGDAAVHATEPILFQTYGKNQILEQRPYEVYLIDHYWVITGTLPRNMVGGTFLIIMDSKNSQIVELTHGK